MLAAMDWPEAVMSMDRHGGGVALAFTAALDQLLSATEINEWAWQGAAAATMQAPLPQAPGHPATWDFDSALQTLRKFAAAESRRDAMMLMAVAAQHGLPAFYDDDAVSVGAGQGSRSWPLDALPASLADVDWPQRHDIPTALVTGSSKGIEAHIRLQKLAQLRNSAGSTLLDVIEEVISNPSHLVGLVEIRIARTTRWARIVRSDQPPEDFVDSKRPSNLSRFRVDGVLSNDLLRLVADVLGLEANAPAEEVRDPDVTPGAPT